MMDSSQSLNLAGAVVANVNNILLILLFIFRINKLPQAEYWIGIVFMLSLFPIVYLFINAFNGDREILYFIQLVLMSIL